MSNHLEDDTPATIQDVCRAFYTRMCYITYALWKEYEAEGDEPNANAAKREFNNYRQAVGFPVNWRPDDADGSGGVAPAQIYEPERDLAKEEEEELVDAISTQFLPDPDDEYESGPSFG